MKIIAKRQLTGDYGQLAPGESAHVRNDIGQHLIGHGLAVPYTEVKVIVPEAPSVTPEAPVFDPAVSIISPKLEHKRK